MAFMTWAISDCKLIGQFLQLAFQMIFVWAIRIIHGGSEESVNAVRNQTSCFTRSADLPHYLRSIEIGEHAVAWFSVKSARRRHRKQWSMEKCEKGKPNKRTQGDEGDMLFHFRYSQEQQIHNGDPA
jgi:hypothetical protein